MVRHIVASTLLARVANLAQTGAVHAVASTAAVVCASGSASRHRHHCVSVIRQQRTHLMVSDGHRRFGKL